MKCFFYRGTDRKKLITCEVKDSTPKRLRQLVWLLPLTCYRGENQLRHFKVWQRREMAPVKPYPGVGLQPCYNDVVICYAITPSDGFAALLPICLDQQESAAVV